MMQSRPISIRPTPELLRAIGEEIQRSNNTIDTTAAITRLALRGAGNRPEPVYIVSGISRRDEIECLIRELRELLRRIDFVKSRLGGVLDPDATADPDRKRNIAAWRQLSEELPRELRDMIDRLNQMVDLLLGGLRNDEYEALEVARTWIQKAVSSPKADAGNIVVAKRAIAAWDKVYPAKKTKTPWP